MEIFDRYDIRDSQERGLRGFVILSDANTGEIYVKKHNLILNEGRKVIMSKLFDLSNDNNETAYKDYKLTQVYISDNPEEPDYTDVYDANDIIKSYEVKKTGENINGLKATLTTDIDTLSASISLEFTLSGTDVFANKVSLSSLGLIMEAEQGSPILFSRITFDPVPIQGGEKTFKLNYYIYF